MTSTERRSEGRIPAAATTNRHRCGLELDWDELATLTVSTAWWSSTMADKSGRSRCRCYRTGDLHAAPLVGCDGSFSSPELVRADADTPAAWAPRRGRNRSS